MKKISLVVGATVAFLLSTNQPMAEDIQVVEATAPVCVSLGEVLARIDDIRAAEFSLFKQLYAPYAKAHGISELTSSPELLQLFAISAFNGNIPKLEDMWEACMDEAKDAASNPHSTLPHY